jgi:hypothetical protein
MKQTAVEWLYEMLKDSSKEVFDGNIWEQAKAMHEEQIMKAYVKALPIEDGVFTAVQKAEQYYKETYNNNDRNSS